MPLDLPDTENYPSGIPINADAELGDFERRKRIEKKMIRRQDVRLVFIVILCLLNFNFYTMCCRNNLNLLYIDRTNIAAARLRGFEEDLHLTDREYDTALSIFYVGYIIMQVPSNMFLEQLGKPSIYLPVCMIIWGAISLMTGIVTNFAGAIMTRFFLGLVEAAFFPGVMLLLLLSKWYKSNESGLRMAILLSGSIISGAFGSLLASGILDGMQGMRGLAALRWLYFMEGSLTVFAAFVGLMAIPDFPSKAKWLSLVERRMVDIRLKEDYGVGDEREALDSGYAYGLMLAMKDWKVWWLALASFLMTISTSYSAFFPTLCKTMGFNSTVTLLLCAPPWIVTGLFNFAVTRHSDKSNDRFLHSAFVQSVAMIGFVIAMTTMNTAAHYTSLFLMVYNQISFGIFLAWVSNSMPHPKKRAVALAFVNSVSQSANIPSSYIWPERWVPTYRNSYAICTASAALFVATCYILRVHLARENKRFYEAERQSGQERKGFRYML